MLTTQRSVLGVALPSSRFQPLGLAERGPDWSVRVLVTYAGANSVGA
jgi:hypothetical protein